MGTSLTDLHARAAEIKTELKQLNTENDGQAFDEDTKDRWNDLGNELVTVEKTIKELEARTALLENMHEQGRGESEQASPYSFQTRKQGHVPDDPTALEEYRNRSSSVAQLDQAYRDGALRIVADRYRTAHPSVSREEAQDDAEKLIGIDREVALRFITTSTPNYKREFGDYVRSGQAGPEMMRTASLTTTAGGFAVPVELDTSLLLTNAGVANPIRNISRVRTTNANTVEFINSVGITAGFGAEATEASDNAPVLAQPTVNLEKAFAFVPMSIEIAEDWAGIQADMAIMFADAKNQLESSMFLTGLGHASHQPQGLIAAGGSTSVYTVATTAVLAAADLFGIEAQLSPRYRANASIVGNKAVFQKIRQFASNGVNIWVQLQNANPPELIGYPAYEWSSISSAVTTSAATILVIGDFNYFAIVDRVGMNVELIPHLFGSGSRYPTGQRGLYMYWRTSSQVLSPTLAANCAFQALKML